MGIVPLGYDHKDKQLHINEAEAAQVRHIFDQYLRFSYRANKQHKINNIQFRCF